MLTLWKKFVFSFIILATTAAFLHPFIRRYRIIRAGPWNCRTTASIASAVAPAAG